MSLFWELDHYMISLYPAIESAPKGSGRPFPLSDWFSFRGRMARKEWWIRTLILLFFWSPVPIALL